MKQVNVSFRIEGDDEEVKPNSPTAIIIDNSANTLGWTNTPGFSTANHEYSINYAAGDRLWRPVTSNPVIVGNVDISAEDIAVRVKAIGINPASDPLFSTEGFTSSDSPDPGPNYFEIGTYEDLAIDVYYALNSLNDSDSVAENGDSVKTVPNLKRGYPMVYNGTDTPTLTGKPPVYGSHGLGSISFDNEPLAKFSANIPDIDCPVEVSLTLIMQPGTPHEAWYNNGGIYAGDTGGGIRLAHSDMAVPESVAPPFFKIGNIHVKFTPSRSDLWVDGNYQGFVDYTGRNEPLNIQFNEIGVHTNNAQWEFISYHLFDRELTETERNNFFAEAGNKFHWGQEKQLPYAKDGYISRSGNTLTAHYTYENPLGIPEDTSKTIYRWASLSEPGWLSSQHVFDGYGETVDVSMFPVGEGNKQCKCEVQVFDTMGNTWKRIAGDWFIL